MTPQTLQIELVKEAVDPTDIVLLVIGGILFSSTEEPTDQTVR